VQDEHDDGYTGPAVLTVDGRDVPVTVVLDARHEPQDGRLHWFGRLALEDRESAEPALLSALTSADSEIALAAGAGPAPARLGDLDPWGRYRVSGVGALPFPRADPALED
jgi:Domain of unknown function (DUF4873)